MFEATELQSKIIFPCKLPAKYTKRNSVFFLDQPLTKYLVNIFKTRFGW